MVDRNDLVKNGQYLSLGNGLDNIKYKNLGVNWHDQELWLSKGFKDQAEYILQAGYPLRPFDAVEFTTGKPITTDDFRGKFLFVDFWGTWCKGCIEDMPQLNEIYNSLDKSKIEFVGIVADDSLRLRRGINKYK